MILSLHRPILNSNAQQSPELDFDSVLNEMTHIEGKPLMRSIVHQHGVMITLFPGLKLERPA